MAKIDRMSKKLTQDLGFAILENEIIDYFPLHWHEFYEIEYIVSGSGIYTLNGIEYPIKEGHLFFSTAIDFHDIKAFDKIQTITIEFTDKWINDELFNELCAPAVIYDFDKKTMKNLLNEYFSEDKFNMTYVRCLLNCILVTISRAISKKNEFTGISQFSPAVKNALIYIQMHFRDELDLNLLAKQVGLTPNYLSKLFHDFAGETFKDYLRDLRLNYAAKLLEHTSLPIAEICFASGFNSLSNFSRTFNVKYSMSPRNYRNNN